LASWGNCTTLIKKLRRHIREVTRNFLRNTSNRSNIYSHASFRTTDERLIQQLLTMLCSFYLVLIVCGGGATIVFIRLNPRLFPWPTSLSSNLETQLRHTAYSYREHHHRARERRAK